MKRHPNYVGDKNRSNWHLKKSCRPTQAKPQGFGNAPSNRDEHEFSGSEGAIPPPVDKSNYGDVVT